MIITGKNGPAVGLITDVERTPSPRPIEDALSPLPSPVPTPGPEEVNGKGKRGIETNPVETFLSSHFYSELDIRLLQRKLNESRTSDGIMQSAASFEVAPQVMYTGIRSYSELARDTFRDLSEMFIVPRGDVSSVDPMNDPFFISLESCINRNSGKLGLDTEPFETSLRMSLDESYRERPTSLSRIYFFSLYLNVFLANTTNIFENPYPNFVVVAIESCIRANPHLYAVKVKVDTWLRENGYNLTTFYDNITAKAEIINRQSFLDLSNPQMVFRLFKDVFAETIQGADVDLDSEFFEFTQNVYFDLHRIPEGMAREGLEALFAENFSKFLRGSKHLEQKYKPIVSWFLQGLDIAEAELTATATTETTDIKTFTENLRRQLANLRNIQINFKNFSQTFKDDVDQFHFQRLGSSKVAKAFADYNAQDEVRIADFPFLCTDDVVSFSRTDPGSGKMAKLLKAFYNRYNEIHDSHILYLSKNISAVVIASATLAGIIERYEHLLELLEQGESKKKPAIDSSSN